MTGRRIRPLALAITAAAALAAPRTTILAQSSPLSGTWVATKDAPSAGTVAPASVFGAQFALTVQGDQVMLTRVLRGASVQSVHPLDGSEVRTLLPGRSCMGDPSSVVRASREGPGLEWHMATVAAGATAAPPSTRFVLRPEAPDRLVVETTMRTAAQAAPVAAGTVYRRTSEAMPPLHAALSPTGVPATIADVAWISGTWDAPLGASMMQEQWTPAAGGAMLALSRTTRGTTMSAFEFLCINERAGTLVYSARPNGAEPTEFVLTAIDSSSATFENPAHDFPKAIRYRLRPDGGLDATISGTGGARSTTFSFTNSRAP